MPAKLRQRGLAAQVVDIFADADRAHRKRYA